MAFIKSLFNPLLCIFLAVVVFPSLLILSLIPVKKPTEEKHSQEMAKYMKQHSCIRIEKQSNYQCIGGVISFKEISTLVWKEML